MFRVKRIDMSMTVYQPTLQVDSLLGLLYREDEGTLVLRNVGNCSLIDTA